jgi:hypothetical protein
MSTRYVAGVRDRNACGANVAEPGDSVGVDGNPAGLSFTVDNL